jgi:hypothetical protein
MALVTLNVYDIKMANDHVSTAVSRLNSFTRGALNVGGVFHGGVEVFGDEWAFGYCAEGPGVYRCAPKQNPMYAYRECVPLGVTSLSPTRVAAVLATMRATWMGRDYDLLGRNCNHFCEELCAALGCEGPPGWLNAFANRAHATRQGVEYAQNGVAAAWEEASKSLASGWAYISNTVSGVSGGGVSESTNDAADGGGVVRRRLSLWKPWMETRRTSRMKTRRVGLERDSPIVLTKIREL